MAQITIPELATASSLPLNSLFPFENTLLNQTQNTTLTTILSYVEPKTKLYLNNVLSGTYPALNLIAGSNITFTTSTNPNYFNITLNSTIPNPLVVANVGTGAGLYKNFTTSYNFKSLEGGPNVSITSNTDTVLIDLINPGEVNTASNLGSGVTVFKQKTGSNFEFKTLVAGNNISFDTSNPNQITINSTGGGSLATGQNIGTGAGRIYVNNVASILRFKSIKAGANVLINESASEIIIASLGSEASGVTNTDGIGSKILNNSGELKTLIPGDGILILDTEDSLTLSTNAGNDLGNVGSGTTTYKGFNSSIDRHEFKTLVGQDGLIVENLNANEIVIRGNSTTSLNSTNSTNTLISSQVGSLTTLKVINAADSNVATITNNSDNLTINILNNNNRWNANKINNIPIVSPTLPTLPEQESLLVYRGTDYITGTPNNLSTRYLVQQSFGSHIPSNGEVFKVSGVNTWSLANLSDSTSPLINFLGFFTAGKIYLSGNTVDGLTDLVAGTIYYLTGGSVISTTPSSVVVGVALNTTTLWFKPYVA
jgi:hypothetical protein